MKRTAPIHVVIAGGGTGGHLFPGLAVAERLVADVPGARVTFAGSGRPLERRVVAAAGFGYLPLACGALPRRPWHVPGFVLRNLGGYLVARRFLRQDVVTAVVGLGGFASVPMARAAVGLGVPLVLLEQNALPGRANRWLARGASAVCLAIDSAADHLPAGCRCTLTGNPLRSGFANSSAKQPSAPLAVSPTNVGFARGPSRCITADSPAPYDAPQSRRLLVLGGSGGARSLNESVPVAVAALGTELSGWSIVHQSGEAGFESTRQRYRDLGVAATVTPFIDDMPATLAAADLAVCRAGGTTLAELAACGTPALLVPYPYAVDDHQLRNAEAYAAGGGCRVVDERDAADDLPEQLAAAMGPLVSDGEQRRAMSQAMRELARPDAAGEVVRILCEL